VHEPAFSSEQMTPKAILNSLISCVVVLNRLDVSVAVWQGVCGIQVGSLLVVCGAFSHLILTLLTVVHVCTDILR